MPEIKNNELSRYLKDSFEDLVLSNSEKYSILNLVESCSDDQIRFMRNQAFDIYRDFILNNVGDADRLSSSVRWLEKTIKALSPKYSEELPSRAFFSPGESCRKNIISLCNHAKLTLDVCVFTISDNRISDAIFAAYQRGVNVRIITDNDKSEDRGSDVDLLQEKGVPVKFDRTDAHMHHKFAIVDGKALINGSFNWTRSATKYNEENIVVSYEKNLVQDFSNLFASLWKQF